MRVRAGLLLLLLGLVLGVLSGCRGGQSRPAPSPSPTPPPTASPAPRPAATGCHVLTYDQALAATPPDHEKSVPCTQRHTSQTFAVGDLDTVVDGHLLAVDSDRVRDQLAQRCPAALGPYVGGDAKALRLTVLRATWFRPSLTQAAHGADWYRCDVIALAGAGQLADLTTSLRGVLRSRHAEDWALCGTAQPGAAGFTRVPCGARHTWKALSVVPLPAGAYPGEAKVKAAGHDPCKAAGKAAASDALNYQWAYEWPTAAQWKDGQTYGLCWAPSKG